MVNTCAKKFLKSLYNIYKLRPLANKYLASSPTARKRAVKIAISLIFFTSCLTCLYNYNNINLKQHSPYLKNTQYLTYDTYGYIQDWQWIIDNPWNTLRTPGTSLYFNFLNADIPLRDFHFTFNPGIQRHEDRVDYLNSIISDHPFLASFFRNLMLANCAIFSFGLTMLFWALVKYIPPRMYKTLTILFSGLIVLFCIRYSLLPSFSLINADPLVCILACWGCACLLFFFSTNKKSWLLFACLIASYSFLVKPAYIFFPFICGIICAWRCIITLIKLNFADTIKYFVIGLLLTICTLAWPAWLYIDSGILAPSQMYHQALTGYATFLIQPGDEELYPEGQMKDFVKFYLQKKPEFQKNIIANIDPTLVFINDGELSLEDETRESIKSYLQKKPELQKDILTNSNIELKSANAENYLFLYEYLLNPTIWYKFPQTWYEFGISFPLFSEPYKFAMADRHKFSEEFSKPVLNKYRKDLYNLKIISFLSAFNQLSLPALKKSHAIWIKDHYISTLVIIILALVIGAPSLRKPIALLAAMHILHMAACTSHIIVPRYVQTTEYLMLMAFLLACYSLIYRIIKGIANNFYFNKTNRRSLKELVKQFLANKDHAIHKTA